MKVLQLLLFSPCVLIAAPPALQVQVPATECEKCHVAEFEAYVNSMHRKGGVACQDCHGGDPKSASKEEAHARENGFLGRLEDHVFACGGCHEKVQEHYEGGPHYEVFDQDVFDIVSCSTCHRYHEVDRPDFSWFKSNCESCHKADPEALAPGREWFRVASGLSNRMDDLLHQQQWLRERGFACQSEAEARQLMAQIFREIGPASHGLNSEYADQYEKDFTEVSRSTDASLTSKAERYRRARSAVVGGWLILAALSAALLTVSRRFERERA